MEWHAFIQNIRQQNVPILNATLAHIRGPGSKGTTVALQVVELTLASMVAAKAQRAG